MMKKKRPMNKVEIPELNPELFIRELHVNDYGKPLGIWGGTSDIPICQASLFSAMRKYAIGVCDGTRLPFRPLDGGMLGLMCERDGEKFWFHLSRKSFDENFTTKDEPCQQEEQ